MNFPDYPEELGFFLVELLNDPVLSFFLGGMSLLFALSLPRALILGHRRARSLRDLTDSVKELAGGNRHHVTREMTTGKIYKQFSKLGLAKESLLLAGAVIGLTGRPPEGKAAVNIDQQTVCTTLTETYLVNQALPRHLSQVAPLLLTLGVIGTFLGLTLGVSGAGAGLASPDVSEARAAMAALLDGAKLAFVTSLVGLVLSAIMNIAARSARARVAAAAQALQLTLLDVLQGEDTNAQACLKTDLIRQLLIRMENTFTERHEVEKERGHALHCMVLELVNSNKQMTAELTSLNAAMQSLADMLERERFETEEPEQANG